MKDETLQSGDVVLVRPVGSRPLRRGTVVEVYDKAVRVRLDGNAGVELVSKRKVQRAGARRVVGVQLTDQAAVSEQQTEAAAPKVAEHVLPPIKVVSWKELTPQRSESFLHLVRATRCMCCGARPPSDPHHAGRRGVGQKCSDFLAVPLCRKCHQYVTDNNKLPGSKSVDHTRQLFESLQVAQLEGVLARLPLEQRLSVLLAGMRALEEEQISQALSASTRSVRIMGSIA